MTFLDELKARLVAQGIAAAAIFLSSKTVIPTGTGPYTLVRETGGAGPMRTHNSTATPAYQRPSAQLVTVADSYAVAYARAREAYNALVGVRNVSLSGTWYVNIVPLQEPFDLGPDASNRAQVVFNIACTKRPS